jgi:probable HAF family extracellular repeat protein
MKSRRFMCITALTLFTAMVCPVRMAAQGQETHFRHYKLVDIGTFGGPESYLAGSNAANGAVNQVLNNKGTVVGWADTSTLDPYAPFCSNPFPNGDCFLVRAFQWQKGVLTDLGVLPGGDASDAKWISDTELIAGEARNGVLDPLVPGLLEVRAALWKDGEAIDLGTLGGNESSASSVNNGGEVVGLATNTIPDPFSFLITQIRAFLWHDGAMKDLGTLGGPEAVAYFVNERGQVAGDSFTNSTVNPSTGFPTQDPFLWEQGTMLDLGTLGGTYGSSFGLNNRGQVVGFSDLAGDPDCLIFFPYTCQTHPFLWDRGVLRDLGTLGGGFGIAEGINDSGEVVGWATNENDQAQLAFLWKDGVMTNLGTLNGDDCSIAFHINSRGQIVGNSFPCAGGPGHGFIWHNGFMMDLNALLPPGSSLTPEGDGAVINDRGEIAEMGLLPDGDVHAFLLLPCDENHQDVEDCDFSDVEESVSAVRTGSRAVAQEPTTVNPWIPGRVNPMMRSFGRRSMPWYRNLRVQPPSK